MTTAEDIKRNIAKANIRLADAAHQQFLDDACEKILECYDYDSLIEHFATDEPTFTPAHNANGVFNDAFVTAAYRISNSCKSVEQLRAVRERLHDLLDQVIDFNLSQSFDENIQKIYREEQSI